MEINKIDNALPWFPLTPDYVDTYHLDVMKYLRDVLEVENADISSDKSYITTVSLLLQRAGQIRKEYLDRPMLESQSISRDILAKDAQITAAAALLACRSGEGETVSFFSLLCYILSLISPELSGSLSSLILRCIKASALSDTAFRMDDVLEFNVPSLVKKMEGAVMVESADVRWFQNHGTVRSSRDGISVYALSRLFVEMKAKASTLRSSIAIEDGRIQLMQDRNGKQTGFKLERFLAECGEIHDDEERAVLKTYSHGDELTVCIKSMSYDTIFAESTDPSYEKIAGHIRIVTASNIRGLYMTDFARNFRVGSMINVRYEADKKCFSLDEQVIDFIFNEYWKNESYTSTPALLLFPRNGEVASTWLTKDGFIVRTSDEENLPRFAIRVLDIVEYDKEHDIILAKISDEDPGDETIIEKEARDSFVQYLLYKNEQICAPVPPKEEVKRLAPELLTELHRVESACASNVLSETEKKRTVLSVCAVIAYVTGDNGDCNSYLFQIDYVNNLISFAQKKSDAIKGLDSRGLSGERITLPSMMNDILAQYGNPEESDIIDRAIDLYPDTQLSAVAKLIQAANRFMGTPSLERLRVDLHREICVNIGVTDCIVAEESDDHDRFPFRPEGEDVEHKMSWVFDNETGSFNEAAQSAKCMKTICAFMNRYTEQGESHLYIGTDEKRRFVCGFQPDIKALMDKGEIKASGDVDDEYMRKIVMGKIRERFPDTYHYVTPKLCCDGSVLDLCVQPAKEGVVYYNGHAYYRSGSESKLMNPTIADEMRNRKFLLRSGMADKIDAARKAINTGHSVCLAGYDSSNSNTHGDDRNVEAFAFTDEKRCDAVWAFDPKDKKNKVFLLRRADSVKVMDETWKYAASHKTMPLDIFGFSGTVKIPLDIILKTARAKNQFVDLYPSAAGFLQKTDDDSWRIKTTLFNPLSLNAASSFYLGLFDEIDIKSTPALVEVVTKQVEAILGKM